MWEYSSDLISGSSATRRRVVVCVPNLHSSSMSQTHTYLKSEATISTEPKFTPRIPYYTSSSQYVGSSVPVYANSLNTARSRLQNDSEWHIDKEILKRLKKPSKISFDSLLKLLLSRDLTNSSQTSTVSTEQKTPASGNVSLGDILQNYLDDISHVANDSSIREALSDL